MKLIHGNAILNDQICEVEIRFDNKFRSIKILNLHPRGNLEYILPGFIDLHLHGGGGVDVMDEKDLSPILLTHAKHGTTSLLLTTVTEHQTKLESVFQKISLKIKNQKTDEAKILGIHLEGPYINKEKLGAQPDLVQPFNLEEIKKLHKISEIKSITVSPELMDKNSIEELVKLNIVVQIGHTNGSYEDGVEALSNGAKTFTHLFNAMSGFHHRTPGMVGAALSHATFSELIPDLEHVHPGAIKAALRAIPNLYFVTDATSATGMPDGEYKLGTHNVYKCQHGVRLKDGTLAGSSITMLDAFRNLIGDKINLSIIEASKKLSQIPSQLIGINHLRGEIKENLFADFLVFDSAFNLKSVYIEGEKV